MKIKLCWSLTGDYLLFNVINKDIAEWFIDTSQQLGNNYLIGDMVTDLPHRHQDTEKLIKEISDDVDKINNFIVKTIKQSPINKPTDWCNQIQLNALHKDWASTRQKWPKLTELLYKIDPTLFDSYHRMNCHIHLIEHSFEYVFRDSSHWRVDNPFNKNVYDWEECHLSIKYPGHGRHAFEKFENLDEDLENIETDNVNWDNIDPAINIKLRRPYKLTPPPEFLSWCEANHLLPHTSNIPLGNLVDWHSDLTNARHLFIKNNKIPKNYFSLNAV
jgi:hypothetical protein